MSMHARGYREHIMVGEGEEEGRGRAAYFTSNIVTLYLHVHVVLSPSPDLPPHAPDAKQGKLGGCAHKG